MESPLHPFRPLCWIGSSRKDYGAFPLRVQEQFGFELFLAQTGQHPPSAKPLKGIGTGTAELADDYVGDTYRVVYTTRLTAAVYVLHAFKKKAKRGIKTPHADVDLIKRRLRHAEVYDTAAPGQETEP